MPHSSENESKEDLEIVEKLDDVDFDLILQQCKHQNATTFKEMRGFILAYATAKDYALRTDKLGAMTTDGLSKLVMDLAEKTDLRNKSGFRGVRVGFDSGNAGQSPGRVHQSMNGWVEAFVDERFDNPADAYREFEEIHPFIDGNGRVGHLLWAIDTVRRGGEWPQELPPDVFGQPESPAEYKSAFGDVEPG